MEEDSSTMTMFLDETEDHSMINVCRDITNYSDEMPYMEIRDVPDNEEEKENIPPGTAPGGVMVEYEPLDQPVLPPTPAISLEDVSDWDGTTMPILSAQDVESLMDDVWGEDNDFDDDDADISDLETPSEQALLAQANALSTN